MTPAEADQRIILSRHTLSRYVQMVAAGVDPAHGTLTLVAEEITTLQIIAEDHPGKAPKLVALVSEWLAFQDRLKAKLN